MAEEKNKVVGHYDNSCPFCDRTGVRVAGELTVTCNVCDGTGFQKIAVTQGDIDAARKDTIEAVQKLVGIPPEQLIGGVISGISAKKLEERRQRIETEDIAFKRGP